MNIRLLQELEMGARFAKTKRQHYLPCRLEVRTSPAQQMALLACYSREQHDPSAQERSLGVCLNSLITRVVWNLKHLPTYMQWVCWNVRWGKCKV